MESDIKKHARLNMMPHLLSSIDYQEVERPKVKLPKSLVVSGNYQRPPRELSNYVDDHAATLIGMMRVYIPATLAMLQQLVTDGSLWPVNGTAFAVTPTLREAYAEGDDDELAEVALREAALASLRLAWPTDTETLRRRAVLAADVGEANTVPISTRPSSGSPRPCHRRRRRRFRRQLGRRAGGVCGDRGHRRRRPG